MLSIYMGDLAIIQTVEKQDRAAMLPDIFQPRQVQNELAAPVQTVPAPPARTRSMTPPRMPENLTPAKDPIATEQPPALPKIRVALVDDDQSIHIAMRQIFKNWASHWALESFLDGNEALEKFKESPPHVVLMDISMPDVNGIECTRRVKTMLPQLPVIMFTARVDTESFILAMIAGASGYLIKPIPSFDIVSAIKKALEGMPALCMQTEKSVVQWLHGLGEGISGWGLTSREQQIILHLCSNRSDKEIAQHLGISPGTVHTHLVPLFRKMGVHTRDEAKRKFLGLEE